jgi:carboxypeptidase family protein
MKRYRRAFCTVICLLLIVRAPFALAAEESADDAGTARLLGDVTDASGKPAPGCTVLAYHLSSAQTFTSAATDSGGKFELTGLPYGYFDVAVKSPDGLFVANEVVNVPPGGKVSLTMSLVPATAGAPEPRGFAGLDERAVGVAQLGKRKTGGQFLKSPTGLAILGGIGGAALLALALGGGSDDEVPASPSNPN